jgi:hypothetical protein
MRRGALIVNSFARNGWRLWHPLTAALITTLAVIITLPAWSDLLRIGCATRNRAKPCWSAVGNLVDLGPPRAGSALPPDGPWVGSAVALLGVGLYVTGEARLIESFWHGGAILVAVGCA